MKNILINENILGAKCIDGSVVKSDSNIRLVNEGATVICTYAHAMDLAEADGKDLICISTTVVPITCKIIDYSKYMYKQKKDEKAKSRGQQKNELKEIRITPNIDNHDLERKAMDARKFIAEGYRVRVTMRLRGREEVFKNLYIDVFQAFKDAMAGDYAFTRITNDGRVFSMIIKN